MQKPNMKIDVQQIRNGFIVQASGHNPQEGGIPELTHAADEQAVASEIERCVTKWATVDATPAPR